MRLAVILPSLANKGPVIVARDIIRHLAAAISIDVLYLHGPVELEFPVEAREIGFVERVDLRAYDVVHSHAVPPDAFVWLNRGRIRGACVSTVHAYYDEGLKDQFPAFAVPLVSWLSCRALTRHDAVVLLSADMLRYYRPRIRGPRLLHIYNGRDPVDDPAPPDPGDPERIATLRANVRTVIGAACGLIPRKGLEQLVRHLARDRTCGLLVVGEGPEREPLLAMARRLDVHRRCLFLGYRPEATRYFSAFDVYAVPSRSEGFPLSLIEAASLGKPVVCSSLPIFQEVFSPEEVSFFHLDDPASLAEALGRVERDGERYSRRIRERYLRDYTAATMAERYLDLYRSLVS